MITYRQLQEWAKKTYVDQFGMIRCYTIPSIIINRFDKGNKLSFVLVGDDPYGVSTFFLTFAYEDGDIVRVYTCNELGTYDDCTNHSIDEEIVFPEGLKWLGPITETFMKISKFYKPV